MPFAGFDNWDACIKAMRPKYKKKAEAVCGSLQAKHENKKNELEALKQEINKEEEFLKSIGKGLKTIKDEIK